MYDSFTSILTSLQAKQQSKLSKIDNSSVIENLSSITDLDPSSNFEDDENISYSHDVHDVANKLEVMFPTHIETDDTVEDNT